MLKFLEDKTLAESICAIIIVFLIIGFCITLLYYGACGLMGIKPSASDIANIFVASATLLGPIILVFTLNAWRDQHNKQIDKEIVFNLWEELDELQLELMLLTSILEAALNEVDFEKYNDNPQYFPASFNVIKEKLNNISVIGAKLSIKASDLFHIMKSEDYSTKFLPQSIKLDESIRGLYEYTDKVISLKKEIVLNKVFIASFIDVFNELVENVIDRSKSFKLELKKFYKA